ncbi:MAG: TIR domain-containing protein [Methylococcales symbiont of Hymedesmia sp. n. MRB-2018]|nr:MAG: TIR domain-containing protein [Methylococcales symbiont of Hymedesmia sp. n. MRB-2018]
MKKLNVFISYSHLDEDKINEFKKHVSPLQTNETIEIWYDRKITAGANFQNKITDNLKNSDIVCLFISANFLSSVACREEKEAALELNKIKGVAVIPIILSNCGWQDDKNLSSLLALPTDAKPIEEHDKQNSAWNNVYEGLKDVINEEIKVKELEFQEGFSDFLQSVEMLTKAHSRKGTVILDDVFIYPKLDKYDEVREYETCESSEQLINNLCEYSKILIAGENQSGKTTLCKKIILKLRENNFVPVYLFDEKKQYQGRIVNRIKSAFEKQYQSVEIEEIDQRRIVPIIDDFHCAKQKEKHINELSVYKHQVIIVDDIFSLNLKQETLIRKFKHFKIKELSPSLRNKLIEKWTNLTDKAESGIHNDNALYQSIDSTTELINTSLGKIMGSGIMPAYPFFILSVLTTYETFGTSLDHEITSQGHCYQALIYLYLTKEGVKNEEIDTYINFLTELSFFFYKEDSNILTVEDFKVFMGGYLKKYNLPVKEEILLSKLEKTQIITLDSCNNYSFRYPYLYYFFVAKYISEHIGDNREVVDLIIKNLDKDENAYITIFISHHSKSSYVLDKIVQNASNLFKSHVSASLKKEEVRFFDDKLDIIIKAALPATSSTPEKERTNRLEIQDVEEERNQLNEENDVQKAGDSDDDLSIEIRRSIKTAEVMGRIIKNRAGSLEKENLEIIFQKAMSVHFRILTSFFDIIKNGEEEVINFISNRINKIIEEKDSQRISEGKKSITPKADELERLSRAIFWNMNFFFIYNLINKIVHSIGSNKLTEIVKTVCDKEDTPASFLVKHGILMWYNKNLQVDNIVSKIDDDEFSETAKKIMKFMVVNHCSMHSVDFKQKDKIGKKLGISSQKLIKHKST